MLSLFILLATLFTCLILIALHTKPLSIPRTFTHSFREEAETLLHAAKLRHAVSMAVIATKTDMAGVISYKLQHGLRLSPSEQALLVAHDVARHGITASFGPAKWEVPAKHYSKLERIAVSMAVKRALGLKPR